MTYQRNMSLDRSEAEQDVLHQVAEREVGEREVGADNGDRDDDDDGRREQLAPAGPLDLAQLGVRLADERAEAAAPLALRARLALRPLDRLDLPPPVARTLRRRGRGRLEVGAALAAPRSRRASHLA